MKKFKGKEIEKSKFKSLNEEYDGFADVDTGLPHGKADFIKRNQDKIRRAHV